MLQGRKTTTNKQTNTIVYVDGAVAFVPHIVYADGAAAFILHIPKYTLMVLRPCTTYTISHADGAAAICTTL